MKNVRKIAVVGPECTGKSWLCAQLAHHYQTQWVPEAARAYLEHLNRPYHYDDLTVIAKLQLKSESTYFHSEKTMRFLFCDTNLLVIKIWSDFKYGKTDPWIIKALHQQHYDWHILTDIDLPWEEDPLREHPNLRKELFNLYVKELNALGVNYTIVNGIGDNRLRNAIKAVENADVFSNRFTK
jgi:NadR type nicotinamide-nucleotide adenylyltransferase